MDQIMTPRILNERYFIKWNTDSVLERTQPKRCNFKSHRSSLSASSSANEIHNHILDRRPPIT